MGKNGKCMAVAFTTSANIWSESDKKNICMIPSKEEPKLCLINRKAKSNSHNMLGDTFSTDESSTTPLPKKPRSVPQNKEPESCPITDNIEHAEAVIGLLILH